MREFLLHHRAQPPLPEKTRRPDVEKPGGEAVKPRTTPPQSDRRASRGGERRLPRIQIGAIKVEFVVVPA